MFIISKLSRAIDISDAASTLFTCTFWCMYECYCGDILKIVNICWHMRHEITVTSIHTLYMYVGVYTHRIVISKFACVQKDSRWHCFWKAKWQYVMNFCKQWCHLINKILFSMEFFRVYLKRGAKHVMKNMSAMKLHFN